MSKFTVEIELGNETAQTGDEVAWMLHTSIARRIGDNVSALTEGDFGNIKDRYGNTVGLWRVTSDDNN